MSMSLLVEGFCRATLDIVVGQGRPRTSGLGDLRKGQGINAYLVHGKLHPKKSCALRACLVDGLEVLFSTTLPAVSGDGQMNVYCVEAKCFVRASKMVDSVIITIL